ncbi:MAG TPA: hypothetical protein VKK79_18745 [Candidatus Lokiarchaeia archaeon]|nr:hypothetical protein [Candidatus Lokiarchaeia archaeon]
MGAVKKNLIVWGNHGTTPIDDVLFDSGATHTVIREDVAKDICTIARYPPEELPDNEIMLGDGVSTLQAVGTCDIHTKIEDLPVEEVAKVVELKSPDQPVLIIGQNTMQRFAMQIHHNTPKRGGDKLVVPKPEKVRLWLV